MPLGSDNSLVFPFHWVSNRSQSSPNSHTKRMAYSVKPFIAPCSPTFCAFPTPCTLNLRHHAGICRLPRRRKPVPRCGADVAALGGLPTLPLRPWRRDTSRASSGAARNHIRGRRRPSPSPTITVNSRLRPGKG